jgi:HEAT repeat protein
VIQDFFPVVENYVAELAGSRADDACHSLLELGPPALRHLEAAFGLAGDAHVRVRLAEVVSHIRSIDALPFLEKLLLNDDPKIWKTALDGLVMLGDEPVGCTRVRAVLAAAREGADAEKRGWIDEAVGQIFPATSEPT